LRFGWLEVVARALFLLWILFGFGLFGLFALPLSFRAMWIWSLLGRIVAVGFNVGLLLLEASRVLFWLISLSLLATVRGGTSFLCQTATKKRSKENAFTPQPLNYRLRTAPLVARICYRFQESRAAEKNLLVF
jgi:hypothetical protein